jgi:hypothetical protein
MPAGPADPVWWTRRRPFRVLSYPAARAMFSRANQVLGANWTVIWDVGHRPLIPEGMPVLIDDDLRFEDGPGAPRPSVAVNRWLRELPSSGAPSPNVDAHLPSGERHQHR